MITPLDDGFAEVQFEEPQFAWPGAGSGLC